MTPGGLFVERNTVGPDAEVSEKTEASDSTANAAGDEGTLSLEVGRVFDVPEAWLVRDAISRVSSGVKISLDFRRTAELHDFALAVLVDTLAREKRRVELRGLGAHHQSLLRLLGRPVSESARVVGDDR